MNERLILNQDLSGIVGYRSIYTYANGGQYELYVKNATTIDYRIHSGMVGGRWVINQSVDLVRSDEGVFKISWNEPAGTSVVLNVLPWERRLHGTIFFPEWVERDPSKTVLFQNDNLEKMREYRDAGPTYPIKMVSEFACITFLEHLGADDGTVISVAPRDLPPGFAERKN